MSIMQLIEAVKNSDTDKANELIEKGIDVNQHGEEQEWTPLNYAAGKGDLKMVKFLVDKGADVFNVGRDRRTPYMIALAAGRVDVVKYLREIEAQIDPEKSKNSSKRQRKYCKAYYLKDLRKYLKWTEGRSNWKKGKDDKNKNEVKEFTDEDIVFIHQDFTVTESMYHNENVIFNQITPEWESFCGNVLHFKVPDDLDLIVPAKEAKENDKAD